MTKILLIEDEKKIADAIFKGLTELGFAVDVAYDGNIGFRIFDNQSFDLVITDINMPGMSGYELCRNIRNRNAQTPIIMLTALNNTDDKLEGFEAGADDYLVKPFEFRELLARIKALLKRTQQIDFTPKNILKAADLEMNLDSKEVTRSGTPISLTAKEFQLLEYFMRNKNRMLTRIDIVEKVWGLDFDTKTNVTDVYINFLRKKIDRDFETKLIQTHVGMGYILKDK